MGESREPGTLDELVVKAIRDHGGLTKRGHPVGGLSVSEALVVLDYSYGTYPGTEALLEALGRLERDARVAALDTIHIKWVDGPRGREMHREPQLRYHLLKGEAA